MTKSKGMLTIPLVDYGGVAPKPEKAIKFRDKILHQTLHNQTEEVSYTTGLAPTLMDDKDDDVILVPSVKINFVWTGAPQALKLFIERMGNQIMEETGNFFVAYSIDGVETIMEARV